VSDVDYRRMFPVVAISSCLQAATALVGGLGVFCAIEGDALCAISCLVVAVVSSRIRIR